MHTHDFSLRHYYVIQFSYIYTKAYNITQSQATPTMYKPQHTTTVNSGSIVYLIIDITK